MKVTNYVRRKRFIINKDTNTTEAYDSINEAKRASRQLQRHGHSMRVIE